MNVNQTFELSMVLDRDRFDKVLNRTGYLEETDEWYIDSSFAVKGILVKYRDSQYKKKVRLIIHPGLIFDSAEQDPDRFVRKLDKRIGRYFGDKYRLDDFDLSGMALTVDMDVGSRENAAAYLKVIQRIGRVKGFSPSEYDCFEEGTSFCLDGNSNGIVFWIYDLERMAVGHLEETGISTKKLKSVRRDLEGVLRTEVRLTKLKTVRNYAGTDNASSQIPVLLENGKDVFLDTFMKIIPYGDFYKIDKAAEIVQNRVADRILRRRMLRLLALIPEKKSLYLAQKAMNCRNIEKVMEAFSDINVSPVTISRRHNVKFLKNLYDYILAQS